MNDEIQYEYVKINEGLYQIFKLQGRIESPTYFYATQLQFDQWILSNRETGSYQEIKKPHTHLCPSALAFVRSFLVLLLVCLLSTGANASIVSHARAELGRGEARCDNCGADIKRYGLREGQSWCAGFVSYVLQKENPSFPRFHSARDFYRWGKENHKLTKKPAPGDLIVFWRGNRNSWQGHVGIVERVESGRIHTIEGNTGTFPSFVKRVSYPADKIPQLLGFVRVEK